MLCSSQTIWVVVLVESGIPTLVEAHLTKEGAVIREQFFRKTMKSDYDATGIFEIEIGKDPQPPCAHKAFKTEFEELE